MKLSTLNGKLKLISVGTNAKTVKSDGEDRLTAIMYLSSSDTSGYEVCPSKSKGCAESCLLTAGRGAMTSVQAARLRKTKLFFEDRDSFLTQLNADLKLFEQYCKDTSIKGYVRLNGTSDIRWEDYIDMSLYSLAFYDYTKILDRDFSKIANNYKLTFSRSEDSLDEDLAKALLQTSVAVVYDEVPVKWSIGDTEYDVIEGDLTDLRYEDPVGVIVGLKAKGMAKKDYSGFVVRIN